MLSFAVLDRSIGSVPGPVVARLRRDDTGRGREDANTPWPWLEYFVEIFAGAYDAFEARAASDRSTGTKQERVRDYVLNHAAPVFRIATRRV